MKIGFIGLGAMGQPMVRQLLKKGFSVTINDILPELAEPLTEEGATAGATPAEVARGVDAVITMLPDTPDVDQVLFGGDGIVEGAEPGLLFIDMSTISPIASEDFGQRLAEKDIAMVDAPVTGSTFKAATGELNIFTGASHENFERARPIYPQWGRHNMWGRKGTGR